MILPEGTKVEGCKFCYADIFQGADGRWAVVGYPVEDAYACGRAEKRGGAHRPMVPLFSLDPFTLPNGRQTFFKIECEALDADDWDALARLAVELLPPFGHVEGVPRGGIAFADALQKYITSTSNQLLIADDVWVTGLSMKRWRDQGYRDGAIGVVAFTRGVLEAWVTALFHMDIKAEAVTYQLHKPYGVIDA